VPAQGLRRQRGLEKAVEGKEGIEGGEDALGGGSFDLSGFYALSILLCPLTPSIW